MYPSGAPVVMVPSVTGRPLPVFVAPHQPQAAPQTHQISEADVKQVQEMFPKHRS